MENWIIDFMGDFGYLSIFLFITLESVFPPIPSEIILTFGGFMTTYTKLTLQGVVTFATAGSLLGAVILYEIGRLVNIKKIEKLVDRWSHILKIKSTDIHQASSWFKNYGYWTVFFCRMVPLMRSLISIPAGMAKMKFDLFLIFSAAGTLLWNVLLVWCGAYLGESWKDVLKYMAVYSNITLAIAALVVILMIIILVIKRRRK